MMCIGTRVKLEYVLVNLAFKKCKIFLDTE